MLRCFKEEEDTKAEDLAARLSGKVECHRCYGSGEQRVFSAPYIVDCPLCHGKRWIKKKEAAP
jgi:hypothetical protein